MNTHDVTEHVALIHNPLVSECKNQVKLKVQCVKHKLAPPQK